MQVEFQICESRRNNTKTAVNVRTVLSMAPPRSPSKPSSVTSVKTSQVAASSAQAQGDSKDVRATPTASPNDTLFRGYVATLKDSFGFIETLQHDKEVFFHFRSVSHSVLCVPSYLYSSCEAKWKQLLH